MPREEIAFTARPKIHFHSHIFRYGRSIFCLPHRPKFSDFFDLCLHWVSVVRALNQSERIAKVLLPELHVYAVVLTKLNMYRKLQPISWGTFGEPMNNRYFWYQRRLCQCISRIPYVVKVKVIYTKYSKHCPYTVAHTFDCVCSKINHGLNHGLFISLLKLILCPINWIVYV